MNSVNKFGWALVVALLATYGLHAQQIEPTTAPALKQKYQAHNGVVVLNFWSTWCLPCIEEIPHFLTTIDSLKGQNVQLWLVSQDTKEIFEEGKLKSYIGKKGWENGARHFWFNETNADVYCPIIDPKWSGVIPATLVLHAAKGYSALYEGTLSKQELAEAIQKAM